MIQVGDMILDEVGKLFGTAERRQVKIFVRRSDGKAAAWYNEDILEYEEKKIPHAKDPDEIVIRPDVDDKAYLQETGRYLGIVERQGKRHLLVRRPDGNAYWEAEEKLMVDEGDPKEKKTDRLKKLLPDMGEIDKLVQILIGVSEKAGIMITDTQGILEKIKADGGITIAVKPEGPIEINLSGLTIRVPLGGE